MVNFINLHDTNKKAPPMIEMFIDNKQLVLPTDIKVRVELNSPAFGKNTIPASVVYHFDLPIHHNEEIFNYAHRIEVAGKYREYNWTMSYYGIPLLRGKLIVTNASTRFRCAATLKQLPSDFGDKNITDFALPEIAINGTMTEFVAEARFHKDKRMAFPRILATNLYGAANENNPAFGQIINSAESLENTTTNANTVIPLFHSLYVMEEIFGKENYKLDTSRITPQITKLLLFNNHTLDTVYLDYHARSSLNGEIIPGNGNTIPLNDSNDKHNCIAIDRYFVKMSGKYDVTLNYKSEWDNVKKGPSSVKLFLKLFRRSGVSSEQFSEKVLYYGEYGLMLNSYSVALTETVEFSDEVLYVELCCLMKAIGASATHVNQTVSTGYVDFCRASGQHDPNNYVKKITPKNHLPEVSVNDLLYIIIEKRAKVVIEKGATKRFASLQQFLLFPCLV